MRFRKRTEVRPASSSRSITMGKLIHFSYFLFSFSAGMLEEKEEARRKDRERSKSSSGLSLSSAVTSVQEGMSIITIVLATAEYRESGSNEGRQYARQGRLALYFGMESYDFRRFIPFRVHHRHLHLTVLILRPYCTATAIIHESLLTVNWTARRASLTTHPTYKSFVLIPRYAFGIDRVTRAGRDTFGLYQASVLRSRVPG